MEELFDSFRDILAVILIFGLPVIAVLMAFISSILKKKREKEIRQMIIENHVDPETAKLLVAEPKKPKRELGPVDLGTLRTACILLGLGLGALINRILEGVGFDLGNIYFWIILAFGIGVGLLCSFFAEMYLYKKYGEKQPSEETEPEEK